MVLHSFKKKYKGLVCLNCTSYMAGLRDVWKTTQHATRETPEKQFTPQHYSDAKVEFVAYRSELGLALERVFRQGGRVAQGGGPFEMVFREGKKGETTYLQIDGESVKVTDLKSIRICRSESVPGHQINIMVDSNL